MAFTYRNCIEQGLLRRIPPSKDKALRSIEKAEKWLQEAKKTLGIQLFDHHRGVRHNEQYSLTFFSTEEEVRKGLKSASGFLERMTVLLNFLLKEKEK